MRFLLIGLLAVGLAALPGEAQNVIKLGNLVDLTGPTSDQGKDIAQGRNDAVQYINEKGGVNGKKLELVSVEYGFQPPRAVAAYKKFVEDDKVLLVLGYGTPDTEALRPFITKDKMPYISGSYSGHLTDPKMTPYNFPGGIDYTSQIRIFLNWVKEGWKETSRSRRWRSSSPTTPTGGRPSRPAARTRRRSASTSWTRRSSRPSSPTRRHSS